MEGRAACAPQLAESGAQNDTTSSPHAASVIDVDKVIKIKIDSTQGEGEKSEEELLRGLLTDHYCHVCEAVLLFESQRLSHYEGKRHAQKLRVYLQAKRAEKMNQEPAGLQRSMTVDKDRFCELCNMMFSSHVVARSHYEGKVHTKNLRKQGLQPQATDRYTSEVHHLPSLSRDPENAVQKTGPGGDKEPPDPTATTTTPTEVDLEDPNKYCALCAASFNNPQMALQHYNGRKHQKNQSRQELLKKLGDDVQQADSLMCKTCNVQFNSVQMYQAHMRGSKHQTREKKVTDLCKSQQKAYSTFTDELSDYIQIQRARGITPRPQVLPSGDTQKEEEEDEEEDVLTKDDVIELNKPMPSLPPHHSRLGCYNPFEGWRPPYQGSPWPSSHGVNYSCPPPVVPGSSSPLLASWPMKRRHRKQLSASSNITSSSHSSSRSSSSSSSSSTSESDDTEQRRREKRRIRRSRKWRERRGKGEDPDKEGERNNRQRRERDKDSEERRRGESGESEEERRRKKLKNCGKQGRGIKKPRVEDIKVGERMMGNLMPEGIMDNRKPTEVHIQTEMNVELGNGGQDELTRNKYRRDKKKEKEKADSRTEEEKLWDDSILGF